MLILSTILFTCLSFCLRFSLPACVTPYCSSHIVTVWSYCSSHIITVWCQALGTLFSRFDPADCGSVSLSALSGLRKALGAPDSDEAQSANKDEQISRSEFVDFFEVFCRKNVSESVQWVVG